MRAAAKGIVKHGDIAACERKSIERSAHRHRHGAEMHRHVIAHRDNFTIGIEERTGIIATLLYVRRKRGASKRCAHFLRDGVENTLENFKFDDVDMHAKEV